MPTGISELWEEMSRDIAEGRAASSGWLLRLARPVPSCPLFAAIDVAARRRAVLLRLPGNSLPPRRRWPRCRGLEPIVLKVSGEEHFGIQLKDERFGDVFGALADDLVRRVSEAHTPADQAHAFLGQLSRWQKFLTVSAEGLAEEAQRGLWGELLVLRERVLPILGPAAVPGWKGPQQAQQDFQFANGAIEVKSTLAKQPQVVRINSERQLDAAAWQTLILYVVALDIREGGGESLPQIVASLRGKLAADPGAQEQFEDRLLLAGYLDAHAGRYADRGYIVRSETILQVRPGFPVLTEGNLAPGIGGVSYGLAVAACSAFAIADAELAMQVAAMASVAGKSERRLSD